MNDILGQINEVFADEIKSPFQMTLGDEFQGLLMRPDSVLDIIDSIKIQIFPYAIRFGVGIGEMYTEVLELTALGSDGPAYYAARDAVDRLKKAQRQYEQVKSDIYMISHSKQEPCLDVINASLGQYTTIGLVITGKSIALYKKIADEKLFAEYYLTGTFYSLIVVIIPFLIVR